MACGDPSSGDGVKLLGRQSSSNIATASVSLGPGPTASFFRPTHSPPSGPLYRIISGRVRGNDDRESIMSRPSGRNPWLFPKRPRRVPKKDSDDRRRDSSYLVYQPNARSYVKNVIYLNIIFFQHETICFTY